MSSWDDRIGKHQIWTDLANLETLIGEALARNDPDTLDNLNRIRTVLSHTRGRLSTADPVTIPYSILSAAAKTLRTTQGEIRTFLETKTPAHTETANSHIDNLLVQLAPLYIPSTPEDYGSLTQAAISYRATLTNSSRRRLAWPQR